MNEEIKNSIKQLEEKYGFTILYATPTILESCGIRTNECNKKFRYIHVQPINDYLVVDDSFSKDHLNDMYSEHNIVVYNLLNVLKSHNAIPGFFEFLNSPIVYYTHSENFAQEILSLSSKVSVSEVLNRIALFGARQFGAYIQTTDFLLAVHRLHLAKYARQMNVFSKKSFRDLATEIVAEPEILSALLELEEDLSNRFVPKIESPIALEYFNQLLKDEGQFQKFHKEYIKPDYTKANELFRKLVIECDKSRSI